MNPQYWQTIEDVLTLPKDSWQAKYPQHNYTLWLAKAKSLTQCQLIFKS